MTEKKTIHIISYTHWDREFRWDYETTRFWLVRLWDNLLDIMRTKPGFKYFMFDGQFALVEDYLTIRPERMQEIKNLVKAGRLQIGPWYTLPDSSSINGESLIRNLMTGIRKAKAFGEVMETGYNVFSFGQISQLPQIYAGFGIDNIVFYKHMDRKRSKYDEFIWQGPDGSRAYATRLGREARWNFFFAGHIPIVYDQDPWNKNWKYQFGELGKTYHPCDPKNYAAFHFVTEPETSFCREKVKFGFDRTLSTVTETAVPEHVLFFDGTDFTEPHPLTPEIIQAAREIYGTEYEIKHSTLTDYLTAIRPYLEKRDLTVVTGHMKDGPAGSIHTDVLSVHPELQKANFEAERALFRLAEPLATFSWLNFGNYEKGYIDYTLDLMFKSHAHDSIQGVGPAFLAEGVEHCLKKARVVADNLAQHSLQKLIANINTADMNDADIFMAIYNPCAFTRSDIVELYLDVPGEWSIDELRIEDAQGVPVNYIELERKKDTAGLYHPRSRNMPIYIQRFHLLVHITNVPSLGYKTYKIKYKEQALYPYPHEEFDRENIPYHRLASDIRNAENSYIKLSIAEDGTLEVTNKKTNRTHTKLNYFLDEAQSGNQQRCYTSRINKIVSNLGQPARISLIMNNDLLAQFEIETSLQVPESFDRSQNRRSSHNVRIPIKSTVTIKKDSPVLEIETQVVNTAKDHFMRVCFETGITAANTISTEVFNMETHATAPTQDGKWQGPELRRNQQHMFMDIGDGKDGVTIINDYLRDYEVIDHTKGTIAQSVVRSVQIQIPCDNRLWMKYPGDDSTQSLGTHVLRYGILVHEGSWETTKPFIHAMIFQTPMQVAQFSRQSGNWPFEKSFLTLSPDDLVLSCVKKAENNNSVLVRFYNPTTKKISSQLTPGFSFKKVFQCRLDEHRICSLTPNQGLITFEIGPKQIITIELEI